VVVQTLSRRIYSCVLVNLYWDASCQPSEEAGFNTDIVDVLDEDKKGEEEQTAWSE